MLPTNEPVLRLYRATENLGKADKTGSVHKFKNVDEAWKPITLAG